ncbi:MAG: FHA domain-containing protein [Sulfuriferula sp.]
MAKLVVSIENDIQGHYFLDKDKFIIGRNEDSDICLNNPSVSKLHAHILTIENDQILEDTYSINGVKVNGEKVMRHILQNNDIVEIGNFQLKYINQRASSNMDFDKTMMLDSTPLLVAEMAENAEAIAQSRLNKVISIAREVKTNFPLGGIRSVKGEYSGQEILISRPLKTFGRPGTHVAMISRRPLGYYVTHVEGKKPTKLNGKAIGSGSHLLKENDVIEVANQKLIFFLQD